MAWARDGERRARARSDDRVAPAPQSSRLPPTHCTATRPRGLCATRHGCATARCHRGGRAHSRVAQEALEAIYSQSAPASSAGRKIGVGVGSGPVADAPSSSSSGGFTGVGSSGGFQGHVGTMSRTPVRGAGASRAHVAWRAAAHAPLPSQVAPRGLLPPTAARRRWARWARSTRLPRVGPKGVLASPARESAPPLGRTAARGAWEAAGTLHL